MRISINNQKGGVGKTTTAQALGTGLILKGYKTLFIDLDPQANLSVSMGADITKITIYEILRGEKEAAEAIQVTAQGNIIPANLLLSGADLEFTQTGREYLLREALAPLKGPYDFIIIDTPPTLGILTINALTATDKVIIPMGADVYSLQGLSQLYSTIDRVRKYCNPSLKVEGILLTQFNSRTVIGRDLRQAIEDVASKAETKVFKAGIRDGVAVKEAQARQESIFGYAPKSNPAKDYMDFIEELIGGLKDEQKKLYR